MQPAATELPRLACPQPGLTRYNHLKLSKGENTADGSPSFFPSSSSIEYFFALDLRQSFPILPRLLGSVVETIRFLGPQRCALSIVEGNSNDGTAEVLRGLRAELDALNTTYHLQFSSINPLIGGQRILKLAALRNLALKPLLDSPSLFSAQDTTVVFLNDVAICPEDMLELLHQRRAHGADMTCAMDWTYAGRDPTFYDVWIARGMTGDSFFEIPRDGNWNSAWNLFWNDASAQARLVAHRPFQVFSCWNGATAFAAAPLLDPENKVRFRGPRELEGECMQGEPQLFCKDLWFHGYRKIAVVPSVSLEYSDDRGRQIKDLKGYTSTWARDDGEDRIEWQDDPPEKVKCIPSYGNQFFEVWNKTQPGT